jgi:hypothetical protein
MISKTIRASPLFILFRQIPIRSILVRGSLRDPSRFVFHLSRANVGQSARCDAWQAQPFSIDNRLRARTCCVALSSRIRFENEIVGTNRD